MGVVVPLRQPLALAVPHALPLGVNVGEKLGLCDTVPEGEKLRVPHAVGLPLGV